MEENIKKMDTEKATDVKELRMEGRIIGITERGTGKFRLELMQEGLELPSPVWVNTTEAGGGKPKVKGGGELKVDDYVVVSYVNSKPYMSHGKETVSRWVKGEIEVVDEEPMKGRQTNTEPTMEDTADFKSASEIKPLESIVAERVKILMSYRNELQTALRRELAGEECGWLSTLFIDHMKEHRINRKFGVQE